MAFMEFIAFVEFMVSVESVGFMEFVVFVDSFMGSQKKKRNRGRRWMSVATKKSRRRPCSGTPPHASAMNAP